MKEVGRKKNIKQIICIMVVIMLCNFIIPNYSYAVSTEGGGSLVKVISQFVCFVPDVVIEFLQDMFVTPESIKVAEENYKIQYSPGTIFSGQIPAFDINFIDPMPTKVVNHVNYRYVSVKDITTGDIGNVFNRLKENRIESDGYYSINHFADSLEKEYDRICGKYNYNERDFKGDVSYSAINYDDWYGDSWGAEAMDWLFGNQTKSNMFWIYDGTLYFMIFYVMDYMVYFDVAYTIFETTLTEAEIQAFEEIATNVSTTPVYKESTAAILQPIISTWYNALRRIAVVGLLSVLVYIGIRILLSSTSAKEKAKYKNMLKDWLVALCLLFTLHYIMNITITVVGKINEVFSASVVGAEGEDVLMSTVRDFIAKGEDWGSVLTYVVIYCVLAVYTVIFTIQYLRRTIYLAFLTMIAPLITLTYPLDKIKDKKSQAFDMWLKDYIFFTLLQVLHLLIYYVFLGSALDLANQGNWLFAIVAIGFITKAEKIMKKMFGFEKSKTMGALAAGATGALVMNAINKVKGVSGKGGKAGGGAGTSGGSSSSNVRTATTNPLAALSTPSPTTVDNSGGDSSSPRTQDASSGGSSQSAGDTTNNNSQQGGGMAGTNSAQNANNNSLTNGSKIKSRRKKSSNSNTSSSSMPRVNKPKRNILNGVTAVTGRYFVPVAKGALGVVLSGTGAIIGFSSGVADGDTSKAFTRMTAGLVAGRALANNSVSTVQNLSKEIPEATHRVGDTWRAGAYGEEYANNVRIDREFRNSNAYKELKRDSEFTDREFDEKVALMLDAGITDTKRMKKILKNHKKHPRKYNMDKAIAYSAMAEKCPDGILYNNAKFIRFCQDHNIEISEEELENLRKCIVDFK